jgi:cysteine desulfurase family protein
LDDESMIYFDNAATSWPKPAAVGAAMHDYWHEAGGNPGRSGHRMSVAAARIVEEAREALANMLNANHPCRIVFTHNATHALNLALYGLVHPGDHVVTTSVEHNAVMRPLRHLESSGVEITVVTCNSEGVPDLDEMRRTLRPDTRLLVTTHASNVIGTLMPVHVMAELAREHGVMYLLDASQTTGAIPIDVERLGVDLLAFTGHKGLLGPTGTGALYIREGVSPEPLIRGGTGSESAYERQPEFLPDMYESGTANVAGIAGLSAALHFITDIGVEAIRTHEQKLAAQFLSAASQIHGVTIYGSRDADLRCGLVSFNIAGATPSEVGVILEESFGIMARTGLHCAPAAHRTLGTFPDGTIRLSFGWFNTSDEVEVAAMALREIAGWAAKGTRAVVGADR